MIKIDYIINYLKKINAVYIDYYPSVYAYIDAVKIFNDDYTAEDFKEHCGTIGLAYDKPVIFKDDPNNADIQAYNIDGLDWLYIKSIIDDLNE